MFSHFGVGCAVFTNLTLFWV